MIDSTPQTRESHPELLEAGRAFFALPPEVKDRSHHEDGDNMGYVRLPTRELIKVRPTDPDNLSCPFPVGPGTPSQDRQRNGCQGPNQIFDTSS